MRTPAARLATALLLPGLLLLAPASAAADPGPADAVLAELTAADRARATLADEQSRWALERERQAVLARSLEAEAARLERHAADLNRRAEALTADDPRPELEAQISAREARAEALGQRIAAALAPLSAHWAAPTPAPGLAGALALLSAAEQAAGAVEVGIQTATDPEGAEVAVQTLRLGLAVMWWRSLDGRTAGVVEFDGATRRLRPLDPEGEAAVGAALAIAGGQRAPSLVSLPVPAP